MVSRVKKFLLRFVIVTTFKWKLKASSKLNYLGVPNIVAKILTGVHHKSRHYPHQYNRGLWKYVMKLY